MAEADEIAGSAIFLTSRAGAFVTGQTVVVDGGRLIGARAKRYVMKERRP
jgi:NAD(P)-dependent dehydrogenase (short-subunit alcohol dehydrogenase family)